MKLAIEQKQLNNLLSEALKFISNKPMFAYQSYVLLNIDEKLSISADNGNTGYSSRVEADIVFSGKVLVPARRFSEIAKAFSSSIDFNLNEKNLKLKLKSGNKQARINCISPADYPTIYHALDGDPVSILSNELKRIVGQAITGVATDESRPLLTGCLFTIGNDFRAQGVDGFKMVTSWNDDISGSQQFIIPGYGLIPVLNIIPDDTTVDIYSSPDKVVFRWDNTSVSFSVLSGTFPDVSQIVPAEDVKNHIKIDTSLLLDAIRFNAIFASDNNNRVKLALNNNMLSCSSFSQENGENNIDLEVENQNNTEDIIVLNSQYLIDCLKVVETDKVDIYWDEPTKPLLVKSDNFNTVLMPMYVRGDE